MKNRKKRIGIFLCIMLVANLLPISVYGAQDYTDSEGIQYKLDSSNNNNTAVVIKAPAGALTVTVPAEVRDDNGNSYQVTGIQNDALSGCGSLTDLIFRDRNTAPDIIGGSGQLDLPTDATIYISQNAQGYTSAKGWSEERVQNYKITRQPIDIFIPEGWAEQGDIHQIAVEAEYPAGGGLIPYQWYSCSGTDKSNAQPAEGENFHDYYRIPEDLTAGTYYYFCRMGAEGEKQLDSAVVTVQVISDQFQDKTLSVVSGLTEVPDSLKEKFDSAEAIKDVMIKEAAKNGKFNASNDNTVLYDVFFTIDGKRTMPAEEDFPLTITLPYPEGTNSQEYEFTVIHMFTMALNGGIPGNMEILDFKKINEGLEVTVNSLSPFTVSYQKIDNASTTPTTGESTKVDNASTSPATGDDTKGGLWIALMGIAAAGGAAAFYKAFYKRSSSVK